MVDDIGTRDIQTQLLGAGLDIGFLAQDGQPGNLIAEQSIGSFKDAVVIALGQDDVGSSRLGLVDELLLEEVRGHNGRGLLGGLQRTWHGLQIGENAGHGGSKGLGLALRQLRRALRGAGDDNQRQAQRGGDLRIEGDLAGALDQEGIGSGGGRVGQNIRHGGIKIF